MEEGRFVHSKLCKRRGRIINLLKGKDWTCAQSCGREFLVVFVLRI